MFTKKSLGGHVCAIHESGLLSDKPQSGESNRRYTDRYLYNVYADIVSDEAAASEEIVNRPKPKPVNVFFRAEAPRWIFAVSWLGFAVVGTPIVTW